MKIYIADFDNIKDFKEKNIIPIAVVNKLPVNYKDIINLESMVPTADIISKCNNKELFERRYKAEVLSIFQEPIILLDRLEYLAHGNDIALIYSKKNSKFDYMKLISEWLNEKLNIKTEEYKKTNNNPLF